MNKQTVLLLFILTVGIITRFLFLNKVPGNLQPDSVDTIRIYLEHRYHHDFSFFSTNWNGSHIINQLLIAVPWEVMGKPYWAVQLGPAILSIIASLLFFLLVTKMVNNYPIALITSLLLLVDPWFLNFSRSGWENIANCIGVIVLFYSLLHTHSKPALRRWLLFLVAVISPYLYHPGKIIALIALSALIINSLKQNVVLTKKLRQICFVILSVGLGTLPLLFISSTNQFGRISTVSIFSNENPLLQLGLNTSNNWVGFLTFQPEQWYVGINSRYLPLDGWVIHPIIVVLFMLGTLYTLKKCWWLVLVGILLVFPINLLSSNTPDAARTIHALPFVYLMTANGLRLLRFGLKKIQLPQCCNTPITRVLFGGALYLGVFVLMIFQLTHYWNWITNPETLAVREPAIYAEEYDRWLRDTDKQLFTLGRTLSIYEWRDLQSPTPSN